MITSKLCTESDYHLPFFRPLADELQEGFSYHRKVWEWVMIAQVFKERELLKSGKKGLGFAVGTEPLASLFAKYGAQILATDLNPQDERAEKWNTLNQLSYGLESSWKERILDHDTFAKQVKYQEVDMTNIPKDLGEFDFTWSSCALEHLGSLEAGFKFLENQIELLKPGGWAAHTTEFNLSSNEDTIEEHDFSVIYRKKDIEEFVKRLRSLGHYVEEVDWNYGDMPRDILIDRIPFQFNPHLKLELLGYIATSILIIYRKKSKFILSFSA